TNNKDIFCMSDDSNANSEIHAPHTSRQIMRVPTHWKNPVTLAPQPAFALHNKENGFIQRDHTPQLIGTIAHRVFQQIAENGSAWWHVRSQQQQHQYLSQALAQIGILPNQMEDAISTLTYIIHQAL